jgi:hypothetical protein
MPKESKNPNIGIDPLEQICYFCNEYEIMPSKAIQIYNLIIKKPYVESKEQALLITGRYIASHFGKKIRYQDDFELNKENESIRKKYWIRED